MADRGRQDGQRELAVSYYNATWELIEKPERSPEDDREMLLLACASRQLWGDIGGPIELATGDWHVAHVASLLGESSLALAFAASAYERASTQGVPSWLVASTCEGLARAHATAGHLSECDAWIVRANEYLAQVDEQEDREIITSQIASIPR